MEFYPKVEIDVQGMNEYICDRFYIVTYKREYGEFNVTGVLIHYNSGNIVLLAAEGIYHIKYCDVVFMKPVRISSLDNFSNKDYRGLFKEVQKNSEEVMQYAKQ